MTKIDISPVLEAVPADVADFTVGFARITEDITGLQDADPAGSGVLVTVGSIYGVLTAAHVLRCLPDYGEIGLVRFPSNSSAIQRKTIDMGYAEKLMIASNANGPEGPDLGFLRLSSVDAADIAARNVFFNLESRRESVLADKHPHLPCFDALSGVVAEWTTTQTLEQPQARRKTFTALFGVGLVVRAHESNGFDLLDFEVTYGPGSASPESYGGMSGGGLWRVYCTKDEDGQPSVAEKKIFGVAFHQSEISNQRRIITCHGPRSVYGPLIDAIREKWTN